MRLNRDVLVNAIIKHQRTFFQLIDYIDNNDGTLEFPEHLYINLYNNEICIDEDANIHIHLSTESLLENGIFIHNDKNTGTITIERVIVDLLRFLDIKRARELTQFDFEHLRKRTVDITRDIMLFPAKSQNTKDATIAFNGLMSEIISKIKENVTGLSVQVESIAHDYKQYDAGDSTVTVIKLYKKVTKLYTRYVHPCYEFINPNMEMIGTISFSKAVQDLIEYYLSEEQKQYNLANSLQYRKTAITSYFKNISTLAHKLEQFTSHLEQDRFNFLAIESAYNELMTNISPLRHGKQRNKYLSKNSDIFSKFISLDGISTHSAKYSAKLNWNAESINIRFKEYLSILNETNIHKKRKTLKPLSSRKDITQERQIKITKILFNTNIPDNIQNIHEYISNILSAELSDFSLSDVLYGLESFTPIQVEAYEVTTTIRKRITDHTHYLDYIVTQLNKRSNNV